MHAAPLVSIVIPCYNEEENVEALYLALSSTMTKEENVELLFIDDGSKDRTVEMVQKLRASDDRVKYISFSRNFGHQFAIKAGIDHASGDCIITMDADLQHPPELIPTLIEKWREGYKIVYTRRRDSRRYSFLKRSATKAFYKLISWISEVRIEKGMADFRLIDRQIADLIRPVNDNFLFLRGLLPWLGFPSTVVGFDIQARHAGKQSTPSGRWSALPSQALLLLV